MESESANKYTDKIQKSGNHVESWTAQLRDASAHERAALLLCKALFIQHCASSLQGTLHTARQLVRNKTSSPQKITITPHATICTACWVQWCRSSVPHCAVTVHHAIFPFAVEIVTIARIIHAHSVPLAVDVTAHISATSSIDERASSVHLAIFPFTLVRVTTRFEDTFSTSVLLAIFPSTFINCTIWPGILASSVVSAVSVFSNVHITIGELAGAQAVFLAVALTHPADKIRRDEATYSRGLALQKKNIK